LSELIECSYRTFGLSDLMRKVKKGIEFLAKSFELFGEKWSEKYKIDVFSLFPFTFLSPPYSQSKRSVRVSIECYKWGIFV